MRSNRFLAGAVALAATLALAACGESSTAAESPCRRSAAAFPVTIEHAFGTTTITQKPKRVATVAWANHEVPLALGVVPVGMARPPAATTTATACCPGSRRSSTSSAATTPVLFDETDGIDFEAVADTKPDVILAAVLRPDPGGLRHPQQDRPGPSPTPRSPGRTAVARHDRAGQRGARPGRGGRGARSPTSRTQIADATAKHPQLAGKRRCSAHVDPTDLSKVGFYTAHDTRAQFFARPRPDDPRQSSPRRPPGSDEFYPDHERRAEPDVFDDVDVIVTYGDDKLLAAAAGRPAAVEDPGRSSAARWSCCSGTTPLATAANPTPLAIPWVLDEYVDAARHGRGQGVE